MKQFSLALNILLVIAVGVLFFWHFSAGKPVKFSGPAAASPNKDSCAIGHLMAFVEMDSVYRSVDFIREKQKDLDNKQNRIAVQYQNAYAQLEAKNNEFYKKGAAITQQQAEEFKETIYNEQRQIEAAKQNQLNEVAGERNQIMEEIQNNLRSFLNEFNGNRRYSYIFATGGGMDNILYKDSAHNITGEVIQGLNKQFSQKAAK